MAASRRIHEGCAGAGRARAALLKCIECVERTGSGKIAVKILLFFMARGGLKKAYPAEKTPQAGLV
jgi:ABC-type histidine transport system ATPase subunit